MAATNSAFRTETRDEHLYNHIELFNRSSSPIDAPAANRGFGLSLPGHACFIDSIEVGTRKVMLHKR